jgi:hypothetical protein
MADRYRHLKKVIECIESGKYYADHFSDSDVEIAKRELSAICQAVATIAPNVQVQSLLIYYLLNYLGLMIFLHGVNCFDFALLLGRFNQNSRFSRIKKNSGIK